MPDKQKQMQINYYTRILVLLFLDVLSIVSAYFIGLWARFDFTWSIMHASGYITNACYMITALLFVSISLYLINRLYHSVWRYASFPELAKIIKTYFLIGIIVLALNMFPMFRIPRGALLIGFILQFVFCVGLRFGYRGIRHLLLSREKNRSKGKRVLIVGAGQAAQEIIKDIRLGHLDEYNIVALIDDNPLKKNRELEGIRILGNRHDIPAIVKDEEIDNIIIAIANLKTEDRREIISICKETQCELLILPGLYQLYSGQIGVSRLKHVEIEDLLGRDEIKVNNDQIFNALHGKRIMVTGGGGSIGSELCRQIAKAQPEVLIIFDIYENSTYSIQQELKRAYPNLNLVTLIGDVTDRNRVKTVLETYKPEVIYHAAAHKHVPLMEDSPNEAIKNNVIGTLTICEEAAKAGVNKFLLISTDKAVNPTNIMGASKRLCEMIIQMMSRRSTDCVFMAVRFGNVLGSNGSVIPLFKQQIKEGGPVTVTDPNIIRYFMTIPEAVSLVLQASYYAKGGEIFVLDMGQPVRIDDMARNLIKLSGLKPDIDVKIEYTGLRPGEKLYEELLMDEEGMTKTENDLIYIGHPLKIDDSEFEQQLKVLNEASHNEAKDIETIVESVVPTYHRFIKDVAAS